MDHKGQYSIKTMCKALNVARSGYYQWFNSPESSYEYKKRVVKKRILDTYEEFKARYGSRRITEELKALGYSCSVNYVAKIMHDSDIKAHNGKGFKYPKRSLSMNNVSDNILWRNFSASTINEKWTSDITYIWVKDRWMYLAVVMDLYSRKIVGWALGSSMTYELIMEALSVAISRRGDTENTILHSDRGVQYRSQKYIDFAHRHGFQLSISRRGNCWDNAPMESFFSRLKVEMVYPNNFQRIDDLKSGIFEYIEIFYNRKRRHSLLNYKSPMEYEEQLKVVA
ncbi:IS3 family transposase [Oceanispirochaeta crateris]|uniref:IS3 family transposase n=1 Tax=Oceanispirochaeta crateris TaxID=2518645 RepID=UPI001FE76470|nr:IS3 family transposase [Oceanispirochaeta crateris]